MNPFDSQWQKLVSLARQAPARRAADIPPGFAARVVAGVVLRPASPPWAAFELLAWRGFFAASACCVAAMAFNFFAQTGEVPTETALEETLSPVVELS
jgi:hypothetical protein